MFASSFHYSPGNTPNASNANTPTRNRNVQQGRDALPPPPPVPMENMHTSPPHMHAMTNGNASVARQILARSHSTSRSGSPQLTAVGMDQNALVMAQLNSQINNLNNLNLQMSHQMNSLNDLPPPPPIPEQVSVLVGLSVCACESRRVVNGIIAVWYFINWHRFIDLSFDSRACTHSYRFQLSGCQFCYRTHLSLISSWLFIQSNMYRIQIYVMQANFMFANFTWNICECVCLVCSHIHRILLLVAHCQISPKQMSPKTVAPPPPPPPPPMDHSPMKPMGNGAVSNGTAGPKLILPQKVPQAKKLPTMDDTRNDLLKAIRDGKPSRLTSS